MTDDLRSGHLSQVVVDLARRVNAVYGRAFTALIERRWPNEAAARRFRAEYARLGEALLRAYGGPCAEEVTTLARHIGELDAYVASSTEAAEKSHASWGVN